MTESVNGQSARLLFLHAQTGLHPGSGTALGTVDLPVQRERHTQWPNVPGSALKGILRDLCREEARARHEGSRKRANEEDPDLVAAFGPGKVEESNAHAGALSLTDARILAFPVRSLRGVFAWVTCPAVLTRLNRDLKMAGLRTLPDDAIPQPQKTDREDQAACADRSPLLVDGDRVVLEEFEFVRKADANAVADWVARHAVADPATQERVRTHLVLLHDDDFTHFVRHATEIVARVGLDYDRKTVKEGALFYQEFLPAETLFYAVVLATASRFDKRPGPAADMMAYLEHHLNTKNLLQVGGDETTGKGLCVARLGDAKGE
jgi:CRISPR-associated protein Cmr4